MHSREQNLINISYSDRVMYLLRPPFRLADSWIRLRHPSVDRTSRSLLTPFGRCVEPDVRFLHMPDLRAILADLAVGSDYATCTRWRLTNVEPLSRERSYISDMISVIHWYTQML